MGDLQNIFTWSYSAASDFETCPRKRYWSKYAAWGGWDAKAPQTARAAYRLKLMDSRHTLAGRAVEDAVRWVLNQARQGTCPTPEQAYETIAKPLLNKAWRDSKSGDWQRDPKKITCLHEHYYPQLHPDLDPKWPEQLRQQVIDCVANFIATVLPRLIEVPPQAEIAVGKMESFELEKLKIFAIPDFVYVQDGVWHIHDWKAGKPQVEHRKQLGIYALWANQLHEVAPENIRLYVEYLREGQVAMETATPELLEEAVDWIRQTSWDMADYLEDGDPHRNQARPRDEWDMTPNRKICSHCNFYERCQPEME
jgi:hypothetical protein